jgi:hypothetical protein
MANIMIRRRRILHVRPSRPCGMSDELLWIERWARAELQPGDSGQRAVSLAQISLQLTQLRRDHCYACDTCGEQPWIA